ncbi:MAG: hypothetical protein JWM93_1884 [Frankiales bacterium]|nr:hypothetical protein [Frankiales bacterium]
MPRIAADSPVADARTEARAAAAEFLKLRPHAAARVARAREVLAGGGYSAVNIEHVLRCSSSRPIRRLPASCCLSSCGPRGAERLSCRRQPGWWSDTPKFCPSMHKLDAAGPRHAPLALAVRKCQGVRVPTYQYICTACEQPLEVVQGFNDARLTECPACGERLRQVFSAVGVVFKGSGFYRNDSRGSKSTADSPAASTPAGDGTPAPAAAKETSPAASTTSPASTPASTGGGDKVA